MNKIRKKVLRVLSVVMLFCTCLFPSRAIYAEEIMNQTTDYTVEETNSEDVVVDVEQALAAVTAEQESRQIVFIGDSRTVGMKNAIGNDGNIWSAKVGMGYSWMKNTGVPNVETSIGANTDVVILMGVNDVRSTSYTSKYISYLNEKANTWTALGANVYYVSVNPMVFETSSYPGITNSIIESWNTAMQNGLSENISYIDTYSSVLGQLSSSDGIHYNRSSYKTIYNLINQKIIIDKLEKEYGIEA